MWNIIHKSKPSPTNDDAIDIETLSNLYTDKFAVYTDK